MKKINFMRTGAVLVIALSLASAWALFNVQALLSLHLRWMRLEEAYAIGYPALGLACWWIWRHRNTLRQRYELPAWFAVLLLAGALLVGAAAQLVQLMLLQQLVALASAWLIFTALLGWSVGRLLIFPFMLLSLGLPLWDFLIDPLRMMTVWFTQHMLNAFHIPAHVDGFLISLPAGRLEVAGGCSGLNLFLAMALVGLLFTESHRMPLSRRIMIVALAAAIGIFDNWIRVFALVLITHHWGIENHLVQNHGSLGWWIYAVGLLPYFWLAGKIERVGAGTSSEPVSGFVRTHPIAEPAKLGVVVALMLSLILVIATAARQLEGRHGAAKEGFTTPAGAFPAIGAWLPAYAGQDVTQVWQVVRDGVVYQVAALTYNEQHNEKKLIYYSNRIADERAIQSTGYVNLAPGFGVNTAVVRGNGTRMVWWYWWVDGAVSTGSLKTKLLQLRAMLIGDPSAALIAVTVVCGKDCASVQAQPPESLVQLLNELRVLRIKR